MGGDARLGEQTRPHADLDIVIAYKDVTRLRGQLESKVFVDVTHPDTRECNFVMDDEQGPLIDMHTNTYDPVAHPEYGIDYPLESLKGCGSIMGYPFRCISLEYMVKFHTGYTVDEMDYLDGKALCEHKAINLPKEYDKFEE